MRRGLFLFPFFLLALSAFGQDPSLDAANSMPKGWGADGWGTFKLTVRNNGATPIRVVDWKAHWEAKGKPIGEPWTSSIGEEVLPSAEWSKTEYATLPKNVADAARPEAAVISGELHYTVGNADKTLPFKIEVPEAVLPEPLKTVSGKFVALSVMESRYKTFKHLDRTLKWMDEAYQRMIDLTGETPFNGRKMTLKEAPPHPWWAYAGEQMILNTDFVGAALAEADKGGLSFGWVHEVGHNFDTLGDWYIWSGPAAEWQANFKLAYAMETHPDPTVRMVWSHFSPGYPGPPDDRPMITGRDYVDKFFLTFGDAYLADPKRDWKTLSSDEMHTFFQRIQRVYGWEVFRQWYRTYRKLQDAGMKPPASEEEKVALIAAILEKQTEVDLVPVFTRWRFPVTRETVDAAAKKYKL